MPNFCLDRTDTIFFSFSLAIACWAVFDTQRFFRLLSFNRKKTFTRFELMVIRVPGTVVILGLFWMILATLLRKQ